MITRPLLLACSASLALACGSDSSTSSTSGGGTETSTGSTGTSTSSSSSGSTGTSTSSGSTTGSGTTTASTGASSDTGTGGSSTGTAGSTGAGSTGAGSTGAGSTGGVMCSGWMEGGTIYVDPALGTDDAQHGSGPGECAVATLDFALGSTAAEIVLAEGATFDVESDPGGPIPLGQDRTLRCPGANPAILAGQATFGTWNVTVRMAAGATVDGCVITGANKSGYCVEMMSGATLTGAEVSKCGGAPIRMSQPMIANISISNNVIDSPGLAQVFFQSSIDSADISSNEFTGAAATNVSCPNNSSGITGSNNMGTACAASCNCPAGFFN